MTRVALVSAFALLVFGSRNQAGDNSILLQSYRYTSKAHQINEAGSSDSIAADIKSTVDQTAVAAHARTAGADVQQHALSGFDSASEFPHLGGHSKEYVNIGVIVVVAFQLGACVLGLLFDVWCPSWALGKGHPRTWLLAMLAASYVLLIGGLVSTLFSFVVAVDMLGMKITMTQMNGKHQAITESTLSVAKLLWDDNALIGVILLMLYAVVIPILKIVFLTLGEVWRHSEVSGRVERARTFISIVQFISKWACPDMFAYIFMLYLFRAMGDKGGLIWSAAELDVGFTCFSTFCLFSTFSALAIRLPEKNAHEINTHTPRVLKYCGEKGVLLISLILSVMFTVFLVRGLFMPVMALRFDGDLLIQANRALPVAFQPLLHALNLSSVIDADVSYAQCLQKLFAWLANREVNCIFAFCLLAIFAVAVTVLDVFVLLAAAAEQYLHSRDRSSSAAFRNRSIDVAHVLKHISMLDVSVMGVIVVCLAGQAYRHEGIIFSVLPGAIWLLVAEAIHYTMYFIIAGSVMYKSSAAEKSELH
eukprot:gnl/TRDRNA2_/TRDRNA2_42268_c0_seq1.p1 gnl/TRDRNA2_/TRDRNA2_42268_c0~~gnl/TRDRNA2_/TRDRNA2_42268_c0_seq1.p1  ORF type:complete len:559 (+),score=62.81 gnl/TRDRNA2_/TRDRNA2_42268_c0_seq1:78-1679(+)